MNISKSINVFFGDGSVSAQMKRVYNAGFRHMDINFSDWVDIKDGRGFFPHSEAEWDSWLSEIETFAADYGVVLDQAHGPLFNIFEDTPRGEHLRNMCLSTIRAAARLGIPNVVFHPGTDKGDFEDPAHVEEIKARNHAFYDPLVAEAEKLGVVIAMENMPVASMYCSTAEQLIDFCDSFGSKAVGICSKAVGICWDTGHAHLRGVPQRESLNLIGERLKCLHVQDSDGKTDQHTAPFYGTIRWDDIIAGLQDIGYTGDLTFEAHMLVRKVPDSCKDAALTLLYQIGRELKRRFEGK